MSEVMLRLPGSVAEIEASPEGPQIGAFFDFDGTLIAGYSARFVTSDRIRSRDLGLSEVVKTLGLAVGVGLGRAGFEDMMQLVAEGWKGRTNEDLDEVGERLFRQHVADAIYPEARELVRAHLARGHTVVLSSSATSYQVEPIARFLGIDRVLCNQFEMKDGVLTGDVVRPVLWGSGKANAVQRFASELDVDLRRSYFYADGDEDLALMYLVGHPRPTNPSSKLEKVAKARGWPVLRFTSRSAGGLGGKARTVVSVAALGPFLAAGAAVGLVRRDKRAAINFAAERWLETIFSLNGVTLNVTGEENLWVQRPAVFLFNHRNNIDSLMAARLVKRDFTAVAKKELADDPIMGPLGRFSEVIFVDRSNPQAAVESLKAVERLAKKGLSIVIAPEGTRHDTTEVGPFKKGAFRIAMSAGVPIVPIVFRNAEMVAGRNARSMSAGTVDVAVLPPIPVDDWTLEGLRQRMADVRQLYIDTLKNWPASPGDEGAKATGRTKKAAPRQAATARQPAAARPAPAKKAASEIAT